jgi:hypothetical protein
MVDKYAIRNDSCFKQALLKNTPKVVLSEIKFDLPLLKQLVFGLSNNELGGPNPPFHFYGS